MSKTRKRKSEASNKTLAPLLMGTVPLGTIIAFALNLFNIPPGWLLCDGGAIDATKYQKLITALGSSNTPNLAGRTLIGAGIPATGKQSDGSSPNFPPESEWPPNYTAGEAQHTLISNEMPSHQHSLEYQFGLYSGCHAGSGSTPCQDTSQTNLTNPAGGSLPHNNMQPYYTVNYIIYAGQPI